jgi:hypothetical protein
MIKHLIVLLVLLVSISYSQSIQLGPFVLLQDIEVVRSNCKSLTFVKSGYHEEYVADNGDEFKWELKFQDNDLQNISMTAPFSMTKEEYLGVVDGYSSRFGRRPDHMTDLGSGGMSIWRNEYVEHYILYNGEKQQLIVRIHPKY